MGQNHTEQIRNIAIAGHAGAGKTTLVETLLQRAGAIKASGSIERGSTVSDFDPMEKSLQHSLDTSICHLQSEGIHVNICDTPGYPDLIGRALPTRLAVETAVIVINAQTGVELVTRKMMEAAERRHLCRMIVINKIDVPEVDFEALMGQIRDAFGEECLPINLPSDDGSEVVDCYFEPETSRSTAYWSVKEAHDALIDQVVEVDEKLMELYLEEGANFKPQQLHDPFERALREGHLIPVCFTSTKTGVGINQLLRVMRDLLPNPREGNAPRFRSGDGDHEKIVDLDFSEDGQSLAHVFKVSVDPYVGRLSTFRIWQGNIAVNDQLFVGATRKPIKVAHLYRLQGKKTVEIESGGPGDILALAKIDDIEFDSVLHANHDQDGIHLREPEFPPPMHGLAITPKRRGDEQKLSEALNKLSTEDPSLRVEHRAKQNETVILGAGDLHLRVILEKMHRQYNVEVDTQIPSIAYRETITKPSEGHHRHKKQTGGAGQFGEVFLRIAPLKRGAGFEFINKVVGGAIPSQFIPAVEKGVRQVLETGALTGHPLSDLAVTVYDGKYHPVDSKEVAFVAAGKKAFLDAIDKAVPIVLEPIVNVTITAPSDAMGDVNGDISSMRGWINGTQMLPGGRVEVAGQVPLSEMDSYQSRLKSLTAGEGSYTIEFSHYDPVPSDIQRKLASAYQHPADQDA